MFEDDRDRLTDYGWLAATPADFSTALLAAGQVQSIRAGVLFSRAGDTVAGLWGVISGQVSVTSAMNSPDASPGILFNRGDWGGYMPLFGHARPANCRTVVDTRVLLVGDSSARMLLSRNPGWWRHIGQLAMLNGLTFATVAVELLIKAADRRVAAILLNQAGCRHPGRPPAPLHLSHADLGEMANLSRHPVADVLTEFERRGWIRCGYRSIRLVDPAALRQLVDGDAGGTASHAPGPP